MALFSLIRIIFIGFFVVFQFSFLNFVFPLSYGPSVLFILAVVYSIIFGFEDAWKWIVVLGALTDLVTFSAFGKSIILFVCAGYLASFLSGRISLEKNRGRFFSVAFLMFCVVIFGDLSEIVWSEREMHVMNFLGMKNHWLLFSWRIFVRFILSVIAFYPIFWIVSKFEEIMSVYVRRRDIY